MPRSIAELYDRLLPRRRRRRAAHWFQFQVLKLVTLLLEALDVDRASAFMGFCWRHFAPLNPRHARADGHVAAAFPHLDANARRRLLGDMWENLGRTAAETLLLPRLLAEQHERITVDVPEEVFEKARRGAIFVSLHTGNWELVASPLVARGIPVHAVYKHLSNPWVERFLAERRRSLYADGLVARDRGIALKIRTLARGGAAIAMLADLRDASSIDIDFFGNPARATPFPALLARRLDLPLFAARVVRIRGAHFRIDGRWVDVPHVDDPETDAEALTRTIHAVFEEWIREHPEQWMWAHRKWL